MPTSERAALTPALSHGERGKIQVPSEYAWANFVRLDGDLSACNAQAGDSELQYRHTLENLGKQGGMLGTVFRKAQNIVVKSIHGLHPPGYLRIPNLFPTNLSGPRQAGALD